MNFEMINRLFFLAHLPGAYAPFVPLVDVLPIIPVLLAFLWQASASFDKTDLSCSAQRAVLYSGLILITF